MTRALASGIDLLEISRIEALSAPIRERFFRRVFTAHELGLIAGAPERAAGFFAAKEAFSKALGCGIGPIGWQEIEVVKDASGKPELRLSGRARALAEQAGYASWSLSISHTRQYALAMVIGVAAESG